MQICSATKRDGTPCMLPVKGQQKVCWAHDPKNSAQRRRTASRGGRGKPNRELASLKSKVEQLAEDVLQGEVPTGRGAITNQVYNTLIRCFELERRLKETQELEERISAIEQRQGFSTKRGGRSW